MDKAFVTNFTLPIEDRRPMWSAYYQTVKNIATFIMLLLFLLPSATNTFAAIVLFNYRFIKAFVLFGYQLGALTIAEAVFCISTIFELLIALFSLHMSFMFGSYARLLMTVPFVSSGVSNWTAALLCVSRCLVATNAIDSQRSNRNNVCFFISVGVVGVISLILSICQGFGLLPFLLSYLSRNIIIDLLPLLVISIGAGFLLIRICAASTSATVENKITLIIALIYSLSSLFVLILAILEILLIFSVIYKPNKVYLFIARCVIYFVKSLSLICVFCSASKLFRTEALSYLKCKSGVQNNEIQMTDVQA